MSDNKVDMERIQSSAGTHEDEWFSCFRLADASSQADLFMSEEPTKRSGESFDVENEQQQG